MPWVVFEAADTTKSPLVILIDPLLELLELNSSSKELTFILIKDESGEMLEFKLISPNSIKTLPEPLFLSAAIVNSVFRSLKWTLPAVPILLPEIPYSVFPSFNNKEPWLLSVSSANNLLFPRTKSICPVLSNRFDWTSKTFPPVSKLKVPPSLYFPETSRLTPWALKLKEALFSDVFTDVPIEIPSISSKNSPWPVDLSPEISNLLPLKSKPKYALPDVLKPAIILFELSIWRLKSPAYSWTPKPKDISSIEKSKVPVLLSLLTLEENETLSTSKLK